jgi:hypothetical protein
MFFNNTVDLLGFGPEIFSYPTFLGILFDGKIDIDTKN